MRKLISVSIGILSLFILVLFAVKLGQNFLDDFSIAIRYHFFLFLLVLALLSSAMILKNVGAGKWLALLLAFLTTAAVIYTNASEEKFRMKFEKNLIVNLNTRGSLDYKRAKKLGNRENYINRRKERWRKGRIPSSVALLILSWSLFAAGIERKNKP